jgi:predicted metalloprotease with PDZ domain
VKLCCLTLIVKILLTAAAAADSAGKQSLDSAMEELSQLAKRKELVLSTVFLASYFGSYVGPDGARDVQKYIENGETILLSK